MKTTNRPATRSEAEKRVCTDTTTFWLTAATACAACVTSFLLWASGKRTRRRAAIAELRLRRTRVRLRTAEAELGECDEYLAATGELLELYEETFGPLPVNPFARAADEVATIPTGDEWPEELTEEVTLREG